MKKLLILSLLLTNHYAFADNKNFELLDNKQVAHSDGFYKKKFTGFNEYEAIYKDKNKTVKISYIKIDTGEIISVYNLDDKKNDTYILKTINEKQS